MCLSTNMKMMVAKRDIKCFKVLRKSGRSNYATPSVGTKVKLNEMLIADQQNIKYNEEGYNSISGGFIHALLTFDEKGGGWGDDCVVFKATIPAGTEFFVADDFHQICARQMFISDKKATVAEGKKPDYYTLAIVIAEVNEQTIEDGKVAIGDFCVVQQDGSKKYIHRSEFTPEMDNDVIGVVGFFNEDGTPVTISREEVDKAWCTLDWDKRTLINDDVSYDNYEKSLNGKVLTENVLKSKHYKSTKYPMFKYISEYKTKGTKTGDWYVGAIGELKKMSRNTMQINISLMMLNGATLLYHWLWSSSEYNSSHAWGLNPSNGTVYGNGKSYSYRVRAFAAFLS